MRDTKMRAAGVGLVLSVALLACGAQAPIGSDADATDDPALAQGTAEQLQIELATFEDGTARIEYQLTNQGETPLRFLASDTAVRGALQDLFEVRRDGQPVTYIGPRIDFAEPTPESFVEIGAGETLVRTIDLARLYEVRAAGDYTVRARARFAKLFTGGPGTLETRLVVPSSAQALVVDASAVPQALEEPTVEKAIQPQCVATCENNCTSGDPATIGPCQAACPAGCNIRPSCLPDEDVILNTASNDARRMIRAGIPAVDSGDEYLTWFGVRTAPRRTLVRNTLNSSVSDIFEGRQVCLDDGASIFPEGDVGCGPGFSVQANAATGGSLGSNVVYCQVFLGLSAARRASIVVHEAVHHFGIEDIADQVGHLVNDPGAAQALASSDPEAAIRSAVNYENYSIEFF
jgi:peptidyl-Lys metalloendopeptidase